MLSIYCVMQVFDIDLLYCFKDPKKERHSEDAAPLKPTDMDNKTNSCGSKQDTKASFALYL